MPRQPDSPTREQNPYKRSVLREAWEEGRQAAIRGKDLGECSHRRSSVHQTALRVAWYRGHAVGLQEADG